MKNTKENKEKFFALYWGQEVINRRLDFESGKFKTFDDSLSVVDIDSIGTVDFFVKNNLFYKHDKIIKATDYLQLTSIADITDSDAIEVAKIIGINLHAVDMGGELPNAIDMLKDKIADLFVYDSLNIRAATVDIISATDYLRKKSYLIPWRNLSVKDLIVYGWVG